MNEQPQDSESPASREEMLAALFANMVIQQTNMALMFLGRVPHPETGEHVQDLETAQMFIDQLDMLEAKTKGNLDKREEGLLRQSLAAVRMAFVQAVEQPGSAAGPREKAEQKPTGSETPAVGSVSSGAAAETPAADNESESRRKFTKKY